MNAVITGGAGALGRGVGAALASAGYRVHVSAAHEAERAGYAGPGEATVVDLRDLDAVIAWAAAVGPADALICCAGGFSMQPITGFQAADYDHLMDLNVRTAANTLRAFTPSMPRGSAVVLIGAQTWAGAKGVALYAASKAAVVSLARSASLDLKAAGVRVNALLPDIIDSPANRRAMPDADPDAWQKPEEVGAVARWLVSAEARVVNGNAIAIGR
jgi:NAD(P)-dependent dehydrogenase (short-subunit alcohol dehydrogenase family)